MSEKLIYLVVKRWPGGAWKYEAAYLDEESARWAASKLVSSDWMINLETVPLGDSIAPPRDTSTLDAEPQGE
jgi:hypothetical protein